MIYRITSPGEEASSISTYDLQATPIALAQKSDGRTIALEQDQNERPSNLKKV